MLSGVVGVSFGESVVLLWEKVVPVWVGFTDEPFNLHSCEMLQFVYFFVGYLQASKSFCVDYPI